MPLLGKFRSSKIGEVKKIARRCQVLFQSQVKAETMLIKVSFTCLVCKIKTETFSQLVQMML